MLRNLPYRSGIFRVRIRLHYTWWFAFIFIIVIIATQFPEAYSMWRRLGLGVLTSLIFLFGLILRQYGVIFLAISRGIPLRNVTLYIIGGVPGIAREFTTPIIDLLLGVAGLLFSLVVVMLLYVAYVILVINDATIMASLFSWLVYFMVLFTFFHIIPGYPLDGGRIFRAFFGEAIRTTISLHASVPG